MLRAFAKRNRSKGTEPRVRFRLPQIDWSRYAAATGCLVALLALGWVGVRALDQPVKHVQVEGRFQRVSPVQIEQAVATVAKNGFISIDLEEVRRAVSSVAWVDKVRVERSWPNSLRVRVVEHVPAARWGDDGLLNTRGELFLTDVRHVPPDLPRLDGPSGSESKVAKLYLDTYPKLLAVGMSLTSVRLDPRGAWELSLAHGVEVRLGRQDIDDRLQRFIRVASPFVATRLNEINYVDMRYSNGFSVGWNAAATQPNGRTREPTPNA
jgi:cell division protein FtsQ